MHGIEMMFSNMIGMKPNELRAAVNGVIQTINAAGENVKQVNDRLARIECQLGIGEFNNGGGNLIPISGNSEHNQQHRG